MLLNIHNLFVNFNRFCYFNSMPSYRTHVSINLFVGLPLSLAALKYGVLSTPKEIGYFSAAYIYGTFFLHPDLDLTHNIRLFSLKGLLTLPFRPYSRLFSHRGLSHVPLIGTLTRLLWLLGFFWLLFWALGWVVPKLDWNQPLVWFAIGGLAAADLLHVLLDQIN